MGDGARSMWSTGIGLAIGIVAARAATRFLATQLYGITGTDPATFVAAPAMLAVVSAVATYLPARRAAGIDPAAALRRE